jgi:ketosteroid isomerase-like protein
VLITSYVEGWRAGDVDRVLGTLTDDCVVIESHGPTYRGVDQVRRWMESWFRDGGAIPRWDITSMVYADGTATFEWEFTCTGSWGEAGFDGATVARFRGERIAHLREYRCTEPPFDANPG